MIAIKPAHFSAPVCLLMFLFLAACPGAHASITNFVYMTAPCPGGEGELFVTTNGSSCSARDVSNPLTMWGKGQTYGPVSEGLGGIGGVYVPASGHYQLRMYWCNNVPLGNCTRKTSDLVIASAGSPYVDSSATLASQATDFGGGPSGVLPDKGSMCFSLVSPDGVEWGVADSPRFCGDVKALPTEPARCAINYGSNLNIDFGVIERVDLPVTKTGDAGYTRVERTIPVTCSGEAAITLSAEIRYTPSSFDAEGMLTSNADLAVAVLHGGQVFRPGDAFSLSVEQGGETMIALAFVAFRNPATRSESMATGLFSASSTLVLTEM